METHGGNGAIWARCYDELGPGVVMEKDPAKAAHLAKQRPTWAVYECDCEAALRANVGAHVAINFVDFDPYGDPWSVIDAYFRSQRPWPGQLAVAVNDGLRQKLKINGGWEVASITQAVLRHGNHNLYRNYVDICQEMLTEKAGQRGYTLTRWAGYYCGHDKNMTHYGAIFTRGVG